MVKVVFLSLLSSAFDDHRAVENQDIWKYQYIVLSFVYATGWMIYNNTAVF